ncbi:peptide transporter family 1 isoform X1 [Tribolium castaneum]|uniref:peptide transporter family 1 isoform X1 n=1 Tax=Tribolium castaneum TaxID=7070 RepID=UPI00077DD30C|nr:PREDICTED: peptide transporter family 1-like isoform X1 [Tribolium castaneum]|eukprot:XP_015833535.1 PREDICTED: peptide transporter family 1-like isoform X1 [Tribolium castaneum]
MYQQVSTSDPEEFELAETSSKSETHDTPENGHASNGEEKPKITDGDAGEAQLERIPYPKSVFFIISNEFCERFSYYGMRTILSLYLRDILDFTEGDSTVIYHTFTMLAYFFPLLGAIISDNWLGKFKTILYVSIIYATGNILLALSSAEPLGIPKIPFSLLALFLIAVGTGGIKPCVAAFGGDQFVLPQQAVQIATYFSVFYFMINAGSLISTFLTPILREDVHCFGQNSCYPLAFAIPGVLMILSVLIFFFGMPLYKMKEPEGNVLVQVVKCIWHGAKKNWKSDKKVDHWLDHSEDRFDRSLIEDIKATLKVLVIYIPLPIFWACYDQQGSGWTFQAARMDGRVGALTILPDQMQVVNPLLILVFIPLFNYVVYPACAKINFLKTPLQRMVYGGLLTAIAFAVSACISLAVEGGDADLPSDGNCQLRIYNPYNTTLNLNVKNFAVNVTSLDPMGYGFAQIELTGDKQLEYEVTFDNQTFSNSFNISEAEGYVLYATETGFWETVDDISKPDDGIPKIRILVYNPKNDTALAFYDGTAEALKFNSSNVSFQSINPGTYIFGNSEYEFNLGGVYTMLVYLGAGGKIAKSKLYEITEHNNLHILWQLPQCVIITTGEILFSITGYEFSYSQAPESMKSVLQAAFLLTSAFGNLIIVIIESAKIFDKQSYNFFLFAGLMALDMILFAFMARNYKYVDKSEDKENEEDNKSEKKLSKSSEENTKF